MGGYSPKRALKNSNTTPNNNNPANTFTNLVYGSAQGTRNNNCYAWAIRHYRESGNNKLQPGDLSGTSGGDMTCKNLTRQALADAAKEGKKMKKVGFLHGKCDKSKYGVMLFLDPGRDYHWYRQHRHVLYRVKTPTSVKALAKRFRVKQKDIRAPDAAPGGDITSGTLVLIRNAWVWSHKRGLSNEGPVLVDSNGELIFDPKKAARDYGSLNYTTFCASFCRQK